MNLRRQSSPANQLASSGSTPMVLDNGNGGYALETDETIYIPWFSRVRVNKLNPQSPSFDLIFVAGVSSSLFLSPNFILSNKVLSCGFSRHRK